LRLLLSTTRERLFADFATHRYVHLYLYVHRVDGLEPGVYRSGGASRAGRIKAGDQRLWRSPQFGTRRGGNACVAFSMIGDFENCCQQVRRSRLSIRAFRGGSNWQRMYLAAEALGLGATGMEHFLMKK